MEAKSKSKSKSISSNLSKNLRHQYKRRSLPVRIGDGVQIVRGQYAGKAGKISKVDTKKKKIYITGVVDKKTVGTEVQVPIDSSNVKILDLILDDEKRRKIILRKVREVKYEKPKEAKKEDEDVKAKETKQETKIKEKESEAVKKHETEKTVDTEVLETAEKAKDVGGKSKAGSAQKI